MGTIQQTERKYWIFMKRFLATLIIVAIVLLIVNLNLTVKILQEENDRLNAYIKEWEVVLNQDVYLPVMVEATGYAPLDPKAVEGMCYSGDPRVTASGEPSDPSKTIAASKGVPFGTEIYIPNIGHRVVQDRGGAITQGKIDIMFETQEEALAFGRQKIIVYIKK